MGTDGIVVCQTTLRDANDETVIVVDGVGVEGHRATTVIGWCVCSAKVPKNRTQSESLEGRFVAA